MVDARGSRTGSWLIAVAALSIGGLISVGSAEGATIRPDATADQAAGAPDDGKCRLREAVIAANTDSGVDGCRAGNGRDTIVLKAKRYPVKGATYEAAAATGDLDLTAPVTIRGPRKGRPTLDSTGGDRVFQIFGPGSFLLKGLDIEDGLTTGSGGGILSSGANLKLQRVKFDSNEAGGAGGAVSIQSGKLTAVAARFLNSLALVEGGGLHLAPAAEARLRGPLFDLNLAPKGGGVANRGELSVEHMSLTNNQRELARFSGNRATAGDGGGIWTAGAGNTTLIGATMGSNRADEGGAINHGSSGKLTIRRALIDHNNANYDGGALWASGDVNVENSNFFGNVAEDDGGGMYIENGALTLLNTTIYNNVALSNNGGGGGGIQLTGVASAIVEYSTLASNSAEFGGGIELLDSSTLALEGALFGDNTASVANGKDCGGPGTVTSNGHNLLQSNLGCITTPKPSDKLNVDPKLTGRDFAMFLEGIGIARNSPARNAGGPGAPSDDMRAVPRSNPDIGAVEFVTCFGRIPTRIGTNANDRLAMGNSRDDVFLGLDGDDVLRTQDGRDRACGGDGSDVIKGGDGNDKLDGGGGGRDKVYGEKGRDKLRGGGGPRDLCNGGAGKDSADGSCERKRKIP